MSAGMVLTNGAYVLYQDGSVWSYPMSSLGAGSGTNLTTLSTTPATQVSAGVTAAGTLLTNQILNGNPNPYLVPAARDAAFVRFADGSVWEYGVLSSYTVLNYEIQTVYAHNDWGWTEVCGSGSGARQISAAQTTTLSATNPWTAFSEAQGTYNTVYILFNDGSVWQHSGLDANAGWSEITAGGARQVSAGEDAAGNSAAFVRFQGGSVWEYTPLNMSATWTLIAASGATYVQGSTAAADTVFVGYGGGSLWEYAGSGAAPGWYLVQDSGVAGLGLGRTQVEGVVNGSVTWTTEPAAFILERDGSVWEHTGTDANAGWTELTTSSTVPATAVYASQVYDSVFVNFGGALWEDVTQGWNAGWYLVADSGVAY
jgi:hypothetical protein